MSDPTLEQPITEEERAAAESAVMASRWAIHRRMYDWVLTFAHHKHATTALFVMSFAESSCFPIPPDVLLMPLCLGHRRRAWWYAAVCSVASVLGGVAGYFIGYALWHAVSGFFFSYVISHEVFERAQAIYQEWDFWAVFAAGFTPIPYKVFTVAAGVFELSLPMFILASVVGRSARFFLLAALAWKFGEPVVRFIDRYFNWLCVAMTLLGIGGFVAIKWMN